VVRVFFEATSVKNGFEIGFLAVKNQKGIEAFHIPPLGAPREASKEV